MFNTAPLCLHIHTCACTRARARARARTHKHTHLLFLDQVRVWHDTLLTQSEVTSLYNDKDTTGLMVIGKTEQAMVSLSEQFFERTTERRYHALVWGEVEDGGKVEGHIGRSYKDRKVQAVFPDGQEGKHAVTHYRVLERLGPVTLVECKLETGRTHQIRVHMQYIGHPLFGDKTYGGAQIVKGLPSGKYNQFVQNSFDILPRQALHAKSLGFTHPGTGEFMQFESDLPEDMTTVLARWRRYLGATQQP